MLYFVLTTLDLWTVILLNFYIAVNKLENLPRQENSHQLYIVPDNTPKVLELIFSNPRTITLDFIV